MGRYGIDRPRVLELLRAGHGRTEIAREIECSPSTIGKCISEFRRMGLAWDGSEDDPDDDIDQPESISWPSAKPPHVIEMDPDVLEARKQTALQQAELARLQVEQKLNRIRMELEGKPVPDAGLNFQRELLTALLAQSNKTTPPLIQPGVVTAVISGIVTLLTQFRQQPVDPLKMLEQLQKIMGNGGGAIEDIAEGNILGTVVKALARTPANPPMGPQSYGPPQAQPQPRQVDERKRRNMEYLGLIARECRMGSDPAAMAAALKETLGVLPEEFRRLLLEENLQTVLSNLPVLVTVDVAQDFQAMASEPKYRAWLETFLARLRETNRLGGVLQDAEPPQEAPEGYDLFPPADPSHSVILPPNGPQVPPSK